MKTPTISVRNLTTSKARNSLVSPFSSTYLPIADR